MFEDGYFIGYYEGLIAQVQECDKRDYKEYQGGPETFFPKE